MTSYQGAGSSDRLTSQIILSAQFIIYYFVCQITFGRKTKVNIKNFRKIDLTTVYCEVKILAEK
ncbi:hypothetical protein B7486_45415 [cyanobacterium TDX16]|nr:hypothetical protein B7486_45415 [cyanobacterium TDX16]